jgi:hypothetical protein
MLREFLDSFLQIHFGIQNILIFEPLFVSTYILFNSPKYFFIGLLINNYGNNYGE